MAASEASIDAARKESKANAKEDLVTITSGAKEKVDRTLASAMGVAEKVCHPLDKEARKRAEEAAELRKADVSAQQAAIRQMARQQAAEERLAARLQVAEVVAHGRGTDRYVPPPLPDSPVVAVPPPLPPADPADVAPPADPADVVLIDERRLHVSEDTT